jgi:hypothetical protein
MSKMEFVNLAVFGARIPAFYSLASEVVLRFLQFEPLSTLWVMRW